MPIDTRGHGERVLVVDDAPQNIKLLRVILKSAGYEVLEASNGPEALERVRNERPVAVVLDVRMPGMDGYEVTETLRRDPRLATLPVILVTALSVTEERIRGIRAGATDFITKPFSKQELLARLAVSLSQARAAQTGGLAALPGALLLLSPGWILLALTPPAAEKLRSWAPDVVPGADVMPLLQRWKISGLLGDDGAIGNHWCQEIQPGANTPTGVCHTPVTGPGGAVVLRVLALADR